MNSIQELKLIELNVKRCANNKNDVLFSIIQNAIFFSVVVFYKKNIMCIRLSYSISLFYCSMILLCPIVLILIIVKCRLCFLFFPYYIRFYMYIVNLLNISTSNIEHILLPHTYKQFQSFMNGYIVFRCFLFF